MQTTVRAATADDVRALGEHEPARTALLDDPRTLFLVAERGGAPAFVLTEPENEAANATYRALGGRRSEAVMWES